MTKSEAAAWANDVNKMEAVNWAVRIIVNYGAGWRVQGVFEAARAHQELPASFWVEVLSYVVARTREKI